MKKIILLILLFASHTSHSQECKFCGRSTLVNLFDIEWLAIQKPDDKILFDQWKKLGSITSRIWDKLSDYFSRNDDCIFLLQTGAYRKSVLTPIGAPAYNIFGIIYQAGDAYELKLWMQPACSDKILAETVLSFQIYPFMDLEKITSQAVSSFAPLINIPGYESQERAKHNSAVALKGEIEMIVLDRTVKPGSETNVFLRLLDCDGEYLVNKEINFEGTTGGSFTPSKIKTNKSGEAMVKFRLESTSKAVLRSNCKVKNVRGCEVDFKGSETIATGPLVKVTMEFIEISTKKTDWKKANPFGNIQVSGGEEIENTTMVQTFSFYHKPSPEALKNGFLVFDEKTEIENYGSTSNYIYGGGSATYSKRVAEGAVETTIPGIQIGEKQKGVNIYYEGYAPERPAVTQFFTGDVQNPAYFSIVIMYPLSEEYIAQGGVTIVKGDTKTGSFITRKITDKKSPYKTEYILEANVNLKEEFAKGSDFGGIAGETGFRRIKVIILSPY